MLFHFNILVNQILLKKRFNKYIKIELNFYEYSILNLGHLKISKIINFLGEYLSI